MSLMVRAAALWESMSHSDMAALFISLTVTVSVGSILLVLVFRALGKVTEHNPLKASTAPGGEAADPKKGGRGDGDGKREGGNVPTTRPGMPTKIPRAKRNIPAAAASTMVDRGHRLREEGEFGEALKCYLALLFASVEEGSGTASLPKHLTDCLRGAAECYKGLEEWDKAVRFLQAERMIYEEMVAKEQSLKTNIEGSKTILRTLFDGKDPSQQPHRCEVLNGVAEASLKHGYSDLGLSYRVKAAAVKHKMLGKPLDPNCPEVVAIAEAMDACEAKRMEAERKSVPGGDDLASLPEEALPPPRRPKKPLRDPAIKKRTGGASSGAADDRFEGPEEDTPDQSQLNDVVAELASQLLNHRRTAQPEGDRRRVAAPPPDTEYSTAMEADPEA